MSIDWRYVAVVLFCLVGNGPVRADDPQSAQEQFQQLAREFKQAEIELSRAYQAAQTDEEREAIVAEYHQKELTRERCAEKMLKIVRAHTTEPAARDAYRWLLAYLPHGEQTGPAAALLIERMIDSEHLAEVCTATYSCPAEDKLLRAAIARSPHRAVQGRARYALACSLRKAADRLANDPPDERTPLELEAEQLLTEVVEKYGDRALDQKTLGEAAEQALFEVQNLGIGRVAPQIEGEDLEGKRMKLSSFRGKVVLLNFWTTGCGFCIAEVPQERALLERYKNQPFAIVGINSDPEREVARQVSVKEPMPWRSFWDGEQGPVFTRWNVRGWPTLYLLDADGVIRYKGEHLRSVSVREGKDGQLEQFSFLDVAVEELMKEAVPAHPPIPAAGTRR